MSGAAHQELSHPYTILALRAIHGHHWAAMIWPWWLCARYACARSLPGRHPARLRRLRKASRGLCPPPMDVLRFVRRPWPHRWGRRAISRRRTSRERRHRKVSAHFRARRRPLGLRCGPVGRSASAALRTRNRLLIVEYQPKRERCIPALYRCVRSLGFRTMIFLLS